LEEADEVEGQIIGTGEQAMTPKTKTKLLKVQYALFLLVSQLCYTLLET